VCFSNIDTSKLHPECRFAQILWDGT